ncbi:hypothetical protein RIF29_30961 [Crotalaria pallida]|uniref:Uncharacterized protein n=1 Tax=Crotalaria pallida TaxID=3830 RepID=A0AAN9EIV0_CROPI
MNKISWICNTQSSLRFSPVSVSVSLLFSPSPPPSTDDSDEVDCCNKVVDGGSIVNQATTSASSFHPRQQRFRFQRIDFTNPNSQLSDLNHFEITPHGFLLLRIEKCLIQIAFKDIVILMEIPEEEKTITQALDAVERLSSAESIIFLSASTIL